MNISKIDSSTSEVAMDELICNDIGDDKNSVLRSIPELKTNIFLEDYYNQIVSKETSKLIFTSLRLPLALSFRFRNFFRFRNGSIDKFKSIVASLSSDDVKKNLVNKIDWFNNIEVYSLDDISKKNVKSNSELFLLKEYLINESKRGAIARQELVSMIPPLCMNIQSTDIILDACSSPGSKTSQILDIMISKAKKEFKCDWLDKVGAVIANDVVPKRVNILSHQLQQFNYPNYAIVNYNACTFPTFFTGESILYYDSILADVPCSGDGTLRKNPDIWKLWKYNSFFTLHTIQKSILVRAIELVKPGGIVVYSTCSMNPIENEAVVGYVLEKFSDIVEMTKPPDFNSMVYQGGMSKWVVPDPSNCETSDNKFKYYSSFDEVPEKQKKVIYKSMFPIPEQDLSNCIRIFPHFNDTGGFFVAVLRKKNIISIPRIINTTKNSDKSWWKSIFHQTHGTLKLNNRFDLNDNESIDLLSSNTGTFRKDTIHSNNNVEKVNSDGVVNYLNPNSIDTSTNNIISKSNAVTEIMHSEYMDQTVTSIPNEFGCDFSGSTHENIYSVDGNVENLVKLTLYNGDAKKKENNYPDCIHHLIKAFGLINEVNYPSNSGTPTIYEVEPSNFDMRFILNLNANDEVHLINQVNDGANTVKFVVKHVMDDRYDDALTSTLNNHTLDHLIKKKFILSHRSKNRFFFYTESLLNILMNNFSSKLNSYGVHALEVLDCKNTYRKFDYNWRFVQSAVDLILPFVSKRIVYFEALCGIQLLNNTMNLDTLIEAESSGKIFNLSSCQRNREFIPGCAICVILPQKIIPSVGIFSNQHSDTTVNQLILNSSWFTDLIPITYIYVDAFSKLKESF